MAKVHFIQFLDRFSRDENREVANTFPAAPDWKIEILSSEQIQTEITENILLSATRS